MKSAPETKPASAEGSWWRGGKPVSMYMSAITAFARSSSLRNKIARGLNSRYMAVLSHLFTVAVREWEWLEINPVRKLKPLKEPRGRDRFLSEEECASLLAACRQSKNQDLYAVVVLAISTGMRRNEILSLRQDQIDALRGRIYLYDTKNGERRGATRAAPS